jgi:adenylate kinase
MDALGAELKKEIDASAQPIIIDGHYSHDLIEAPTHVIVLRKAPWELHDILQNRLYSYEKVWENLEAEIMGVIAEESLENYPAEIIHECDTTGKTPEESVEEIIKVINKETPPHIEPIDWITYPETLRVLVNKTCTLS